MTTKHLVYTALMTAIICIFRFSTKCTSAIYASPYCITEYRNLFGRNYFRAKAWYYKCYCLLLLVATGLPVLSGGRGGIGVFAGPSAGFLFLYPVVAYFIGIIRDAYLHKINFLVIFIATLVIGVLGLDILGTLIMGFIIHIPISKAFILSFTFMPGDIIKAIIASLIGAAILNHSRFKTLIQ